MLNNVKIWWVNVFQSQFERNLTNDDAALVEIMASTLVEMNDEQVNFRSNENGFIVQSNPPLHRIIWSWCNYMNNHAQQSPVRKNLSMGWRIFKLIIHLNNVFMTEAYWQIGMDSIQRLSSPDDILILSISGASFHLKGGQGKAWEKASVSVSCGLITYRCFQGVQFRYIGEFWSWTSGVVIAVNQCIQIYMIWKAIYYAMVKYM